MYRSISIAALALVVSACNLSLSSTPTVRPSVTVPPTSVPTSLPTPESTPTILPSGTAPSSKIPPSLPTPSLVQGWLVYQNDLLGYEFSYPPSATISSTGPDGYPLDDIPPDASFDFKTFDLFARLEGIYPDDLCVAVEYEGGFVIIAAPLNRGGEFVTCGVTGVGVADFIERSETIVIDGRPYSATGIELYERDANATFLRAFFGLHLADGTRIQYGGGGATYEGYLQEKEVLLQILASYHQTLVEPTCAASRSRLIPGLFAVVMGGPNDPPNRLRSAPDTSAEIITRIASGRFVFVLEGPICADGVVFWKVVTDGLESSHQEGWTAEGDGTKYYLVPYKP